MSSLKKILLPAVCLLISIMLWKIFTPGYLSYDSAYQWWQARHAQYETIAPPLMSQLWNLTLHAGLSVSGFLFLQILYYSAAIAFFASQISTKNRWRIPVFILLLFWPPLLGLLPHLWKDLWACASLMFSVGFLVAEWRKSSRWRLLTAFCFATLACMFRDNAITSLLPVCIWIAWRLWPHKRLPMLGTTLILIAGTLLLPSLPEKIGSVRKVNDRWSVIALWDLGVISIKTDRMLIPAEVRSNDLTVDDLRPLYLDYSLGAMPDHPKLIHSFDVNYTSTQRGALLRAWVQLPFEHPKEYFDHRSKLLAYMLGFNLKELPDHQTYAPGIVPYEDNPALTLPSDTLREGLQKKLNGLVDGPLHWFWIYLCINTALLLYCLWHRKQKPHLDLLLMILCSAWLYFLPFPIVSGSAEFRYFNWPILSTLAGLCLFISLHRSNPSPESA